MSNDLSLPREATPRLTARLVVLMAICRVPAAPRQRDTSLRRIILVRVFSDGIIGYGEATSPEAPFYNHESTGTAWHILKDFILSRVLHAKLDKPEEVAPLLRPIRGHNMAKAAVETALWDLYARQRQQPLYQLLGGKRKFINCGVYIGFQDRLTALMQKIVKELKAGL